MTDKVVPPCQELKGPRGGGVGEPDEVDEDTAAEDSVSGFVVRTQ
jgi:hypothetical protein